MDRRFNDLEGHDAYELLGLTEGCSDRLVNQAYRRQAREWHPDKNQRPSARAATERKMRLLNAARDVLLNHRTDYDLYRRACSEPEEPTADLQDDPWDDARTDVFPTADPNQDAGAGARQPGKGAADHLWNGAGYDDGSSRVPPHPHPPPWDQVPHGHGAFRQPTVEEPRTTPAYDRYAPPSRFQQVPQRNPPFPAPPYPSRQRRLKDSRIGCLWGTALAIIVFMTCLAVSFVVVSKYSFQVEVPVELSGSWVGSGLYPGTEQLYVVRISLQSGSKNGKVDYPLHSCTGTIIPAKLSNGRLAVRQQFTQHDGCVNREMELSRRDDGKLNLFREGQVVTLNREPDAGPFRLPESLVGSWAADGVELILDDKTVGTSGTVEWEGKKCILVAVASGDDSATLAVGGTNCKRHGIWSLTVRKGRLIADFKGTDGRNIDDWSASRKT
ncbi:J domain-containing protein [Nonomuraea sp. SYSU D8015]|uniref:J domain-containing protein n=1 Tax=Nonomuraea sp. SYSU D8015 TaxID=2593644 RepID=UPI0016609E4D|nr:J domain-containing protein [Nonomuraea sp. SYSU D8015]